MTLFELMVLAKKDPQTAGNHIQAFAKEKFKLPITDIKINQSAVSLNSVNGFLILKDGKELFFKFHAEEGETETLDEYYRAEVMEQAGYPVITPLYKSTAPGEQFLIYEKIEAPTFFDVMSELDEEFLFEGSYKNEHDVTAVMQAEKALMQKNVEIFQKTHDKKFAEEIDKESIWQLFYRRLVGLDTIPRVDLFYAGKQVPTPDGEVSFDELKKYIWVVNGSEYQESLEQIIEKAKEVVNPFSQKEWDTVAAHGDDHNGNKFFIHGELKYFDPAFASNSVPLLLAPIKTTFHDTFAHPFWLYSPEKIEEKLSVDFRVENGKIYLDHNFNLMDIAPIRKEFLRKKIEILWRTVFEMTLHLDAEWRLEFIKKALFCCPFLCLNLINPEKFTGKTALFALSRCVKMGTYAKGNLVDELFREVM